MRECEEVAVQSVLVVDEDRGTARLVADVLERQHYRILVARDGTDVWPVIEQTPIELVIVELLVPGMNGWEVIRRLRHRFWPNLLPVAPDCKIIAICRRADVETAAFARRLGANAFLSKPLSRTGLVHTVRSVLAGDAAPFARSAH